jgi:hypothetical protein
MKTDISIWSILICYFSEETRAVWLFVILFTIQFPWFHNDTEFTFCWCLAIRQSVVLKHMIFATMISSLDRYFLWCQQFVILHLVDTITENTIT